MKKIIFTAVFIGLGSASAFAADVASRSYTQAPSAAPTGSWSGFYVGGHVGGLWTSSDAAWDPLPSPALFGINPIAGTLKGSSAAGGLHAGYNWQFAPTLLAGLGRLDMDKTVRLIHPALDTFCHWSGANRRVYDNEQGC